LKLSEETSTSSCDMVSLSEKVETESSASKRSKTSSAAVPVLRLTRHVTAPELSGSGGDRDRDYNSSNYSHSPSDADASEAGSSGFAALSKRAEEKRRARLGRTESVQHSILSTKVKKSSPVGAHAMRRSDQRKLNIAVRAY